MKYEEFSVLNYDTLFTGIFRYDKKDIGSETFLQGDCNWIERIRHFTKKAFFDGSTWIFVERNLNGFQNRFLLPMAIGISHAWSHLPLTNVHQGLRASRGERPVLSKVEVSRTKREAARPPLHKVFERSREAAFALTFYQIMSF